MKKKIVGILVVTLLIATALPAVGAMNVDEPKLLETPVNPDVRTSENMNKGGPVWHIGPICWLPDCDWNYWDDSDILYTHELTDRVGIGTANPTDKLHISVSGTKNEGILIEHTGIDAIISDFDMPGMDGFEFTREVRTNPAYERYASTPILGLGDFLEDKRGYLTEYREKPIAYTEIITIINGFIRSGSE